MVMLVMIDLHLMMMMLASQVCRLAILMMMVVELSQMVKMMMLRLSQMTGMHLVVIALQMMSLVRER